ncbi:MAG: creatininase family protein [Bacillota bacterium]
MPGVSKYAELTLSELQQIDPRKTICLIAVSPLEVHGPHLPLGTDVFVGEKLQREYCKALAERYPDFHLLILPTIYAGCDPLPLKGSISVRAKTLERLLEDFVRSLAGQGFRYLIVCDNHGGPSHQLAMEIAARKAWRRFRFALINPFNVIFKKMVQHDRSFLELINLPPGRCGDDPDAHAGTNETSLMLATNANLIKCYKDVPASLPPEKTGVTAAMARIAGILNKCGFTQLKADLEHLASLLAWINAPGMQPYLGSPGLATPEAGERMIKGHVSVAMELVAEALAGKKPFTGPMLWWMRFFRR